MVTGWADAVWEIGRAFGTIGMRRGDVQLEVTTYRAEAYDADSRKPQVAFGDSLEDDLFRRDFTINAMALRLPGLELVDPHGGIKDLHARALRTPGAPEDSFSDDPLRMMRAARFASQLDVEVAPEVRAAMTGMAERIAIVSAERVREELVKLVCGRRPRRGIDLLVSTGLAEVVLPEVPALQLETDEHHRHKDVYQHSLTVMEQAAALESGPDGPVPGPDFALRFAALMHDVGKPATRRFEESGAVSFRHHEVVGAKLTAKRMRALRFDNDTIRTVGRLVELHMRFYGYGDAEWTDSAVRRYVRDAGECLERLHRLTRADVLEYARAPSISSSSSGATTRPSTREAMESMNRARPGSSRTSREASRCRRRAPGSSRPHPAPSSAASAPARRACGSPRSACRRTSRATAPGSSPARWPPRPRSRRPGRSGSARSPCRAARTTRPRHWPRSGR